MIEDEKNHHSSDSASDIHAVYSEKSGSSNPPPLSILSCGYEFPYYSINWNP